MVKYKIITPAGVIITEDINEAIECKRLYGYAYVVIREDEKTKTQPES
jgi:hypothetical protein